jgi:di/tricarboxylate transporter
MELTHPQILVLGVLTGANCSFLTPTAHPAGAMVVGPEKYRPRDYLRVGTPMAMFLYGAASLVLSRLWPFSPG